MAEISRGGKKGRKIGRNIVKCAAYKLKHVRERNKLKRIVRSNGLEFAQDWAGSRGVLGLVNKIQEEKQ
jgi:hypothetical protein